MLEPASSPLDPNLCSTSDFDWNTLSGELGIDSRAPLVLALSGGADSVYLLDGLCRAEPRPALLCIHINHGLRAHESEGDAEFCRSLCAERKLRFELVEGALDPEASDLERRARDLRYSSLGELAVREGFRYVVTAHHREDRIETLLMRWMRGSSPPGLVGLRPRADFPLRLPGSETLTLLRPLLAIPAQRIRRSLSERQIRWREDSSNLDGRFTRNRIRRQLLPLLRETCGEAVQTDLAAFQEALARLEATLAPELPEFHFEQRRRAGRTARVFPRQKLEAHPRPLVERALHRTLVRLTSFAPRKRVLDGIFSALATGNTGHWNLRGDWRLWLSEDHCWLFAPDGDFLEVKR